LFMFNPINLNLTFDDAATQGVPAPPTLVNSGLYKPTNYSSNTNMPSFTTNWPPRHPYGTSLSVLNGSTPNGTWSLFVTERTTNGYADYVPWTWSLSLLTTNSVGTNNFSYTNLFSSDAFYVSDGGVATPYPSQILVPTNTVGKIAKVTVQLSSPTQTFPEDLDVLLVNPTTNLNVMLMAGAGTLDTNRNALYVDYLEFRNYMTNFDGNGNLANLSFGPGMKIYCAQLIINGVSYAEALNGKNGGGLNWVSSYAGAFSSTNVIFSDGTTNRLNTALVQSLSVLTPASLVLAVTFTNQPVPTVLLSWNSTPLTNEYSLYASSSLLLPLANWQLVTNFSSANPIGTRLTVADAITNSGPRYYGLSSP